MGWVESLRDQIVGLDTSPLIYFIEEHPVFLAAVTPFFQAVQNNQIHVVTSTITLTEVLVRPLRINDANLVRQYREILLHSDGISCVPPSSVIAEEAARLRAQHSIRTPDAIQLATAIHQGASHFLTNDCRLPTIPGLSIMTLSGLSR